MICFGEDMKEVRLELEYMTETSKPAFEKRSVTLLDALNNSFKQLNRLVQDRSANPITLLGRTLFDKTVDVHWSSAIILANCQKVRQFCADYVVKR